VPRIIFCLIVIFVCFARPAFSLTIGPDPISIISNPGETVRKSITVINDNNNQCKINLYLMDTIYSGNIKKYVAPSKNSVAKYINIFPSQFILKALEKKQLELIMKVPEKLSGSSQLRLFIESSPDVPPQFVKKKMIKVTRISIPLNFEVNGTVKLSARINGVKVLQNKNEPLGFEIEVLNQGDANIDGKAMISLMDSEYNFIGKVDTGQKFLPPFRGKTLTGTWRTQLPKGSYHALITFFYRDKDVTIDKAFDIK
jgi:hypothetical protein